MLFISDKNSIYVHSKLQNGKWKKFYGEWVGKPEFWALKITNH